MAPANASADVLRLLAGFIEAPGDAHAEWATALGLEVPPSLAVWQARHTEAFVEQCYPFASVYLGREGAIGGEAADRVGGFRRLLGAQIDGAPDALAPLLADYAALVERGQRDPQARHARRALLWEHLLCWLMPYLESVIRSAPAPYDGWAGIAQQVFRAEARALGLPEQLPLQLRAAPVPDSDPDGHDLDEILAALLVPVRSGVIWTRRDLAVVAENVGIAVGVGSRSFLLRRLLEQAPAVTLRQLAGMARAQAQANADEQHLIGDIAAFWSTRGRASADLLGAMAARAKTSAVGGGQTPAPEGDYS